MDSSLHINDEQQTLNEWQHYTNHNHSFSKQRLHTLTGKPYPFFRTNRCGLQAPHTN